MKNRFLLIFVVLLIFSLGNFLQISKAGVSKAFVQTAPTLSINDVSVVEGNSGTVQMTFTVSLTGTHLAVGVRYATADGLPPNGATAPGDYLSRSGVLMFPSGTGDATQTVAITLNGDTTVEADETFFVNLSNADGANIVDGQGIGTIINDDGGSGCIFSINPTNANFPVNGGANSVAVTATAGCVWTATSNSPWISITNTSPTPDGGTVNYSVAANASTARFGSMTIAGQTFRVTQDGIEPTVSISDASVTEGNAGTVNAVFTVTLSEPVSFSVDVSYRTADSTAMVTDNDYSRTSSRVTFPANDNTPQTISVPVIGDTRNEPDEFFEINLLSISSGIGIGNTPGIGTIFNDDNVGACAYSLSSISQRFPVNGGSGTIAVTAPDGCNWSAASNDNWIRITSGANGVANGVVGYTVESQATYIAGFTDSNNFPIANAAQPIPGGGQQDAFVAKLNPTGTALLYSTYFGGDGQDNASAMALDSAGNAYVTGDTDSTNFPTVSAVQRNYSGSSDAFIAKLNATGSALVYSTYLGGSAIDGGTALAVSAAGEAYVTGFTASKNFPTVNPVQAENAGASFDAFFAKLSPSGNQLLFSTYLGGANIDAGFGISLDSAGNAYVMGQTTSQNFPTANPLQRDFGGGAADLFIAKIAIGLQLNDLSINGKKLIVFGSGFDNGAKILLNGQEQQTLPDEQNPTTVLISRKAGKRIPQGQAVVIQVRNADGKLSNQLNFTR